jgi:P-type conjugative transfer protein TrbG
MRQIPLSLALMASVSLAACSTTNWTPPEISYDETATPTPAALAAEPPRPVEIVQVPTPLPLPGQLQRVPPARTQAPEAADPRARVEAANSAARVQPFRSGYFNAVQVYPYSEGALYQVYAAPGQVTDIALQPGEQLVGSGPVAAGDTVRWIIGDTVSGTGATARVHILVKPVRPDLQTNLVINTDRRTYHLELRSAERTYMASVSWSYPQDALIALRRRNEEAAAAQPAATSTLPAIENLNFRYRIEGDHPAWRPVRAFDDGRQVFIEFPSGIAQGEMPPLWIIGSAGDAQLVNYRIRGRYMVVDRLFGGAELRLGGDRQRRVRIVRTDARPTS